MDGNGGKSGDGVVVAVVAGGTSDGDGEASGSTFLSDSQLRAEFPADIGRLRAEFPVDTGRLLSEALREPFE